MQSVIAGNFVSCKAAKHSGRAVSLPRKTSLTANCCNREKVTEMEKATRLRYTLEYKQKAVRLVAPGESAKLCCHLLCDAERGPLRLELVRRVEDGAEHLQGRESAIRRRRGGE